jgi:glycosyltransferase involved in cell wall biosynthesis
MRPLSIFIIHPSRVLTDHVGNGDGLIAHGFIEGLARRGHELHVAYEHAALKRPLHPNVRLYRVPVRAQVEAVRRIEYMLRVRALYERLRRRQRFDLVQQMNPVFTPLSLALAGCAPPLVLGTYVPHWPAHHRGAALKAAGCGLAARLQQRLAAALLVTTPAALERIDDDPKIRSKVRYLEHAVDDAFLHDTESRATLGDLEVLFIGSLLEKKGIFNLLRAFGRLLGDVPTARLRIVGDGEAMERVRHDAAATAGGSGRITLHGATSRASIPQMIARCDVFCLPSHGEPYATAVLEAMACGKPVVTTDTGGFPYLVPDAGGIRVPQGDDAALTAALLRLLRSPELRRRMGEHNRRIVEARYTWSRVLDKLEAVYGEVAT